MIETAAHQEDVTAPADRRRVLVVHNPTAGLLTRWRLRRVLRHLQRLGATVTLRRTTARGDAEAFASAASCRDFDVIVAAGGDGTVNEVANGLADPDLPLAILPLGTANLLAAEIGLPTTARALANTIVCGRAMRINLGLANDRRFLMMAGVGFDAHVVARVDPRFKRLLGQAVYWFESLAGMFRFRERHYQVVIDGRAYAAASLVIANGRHYGGPFTCTPEARLDDPHLHVCLFGRAGAWNVLRYGWALLRGRLHRLPDVRVIRGSTVLVDGARGEPVQCDGDIAVRLPLEARPTGLAVPVIVG